MRTVNAKPKPKPEPPAKPRGLKAPKPAPGCATCARLIDFLEKMAMPQQQNAAQPGTATRAVGFAVAHYDSE